MKKIVIKEEIQLPGTDLILEKGDVVMVKEGKLTESPDDTARDLYRAIHALQDYDFFYIARCLGLAFKYEVEGGEAEISSRTKKELYQEFGKAFLS